MHILDAKKGLDFHHKLRITPLVSILSYSRITRTVITFLKIRFLYDRKQNASTRPSIASALDFWTEISAFVVHNVMLWFNGESYSPQTWHVTGHMVSIHNGFFLHSVKDHLLQFHRGLSLQPKRIKVMMTKDSWAPNTMIQDQFQTDLTTVYWHLVDPTQ